MLWATEELLQSTRGEMSSSMRGRGRGGAGAVAKVPLAGSSPPGDTEWAELVERGAHAACAGPCASLTSQGAHAAAAAAAADKSDCLRPRTWAKAVARLAPAESPAADRGVGGEGRGAVVLQGGGGGRSGERRSKVALLVGRRAEGIGVMMISHHGRCHMGRKSQHEPDPHLKKQTNKNMNINIYDDIII